MLENKVILITGGTGSFGQMFMETILVKYPSVKKVIIYSRDEYKQSELQKKYPQSEFPNLRFYIGDIRDKDRLKQACEGVDKIIHAAALKQVDTAEYNPTECVRTNINGAENVINAALECGIEDVVALSTDKACAPINLYGATKLVSDKLFIAANNIKGSKKIKFSVVRYGNVMFSRGSVIPLFLSKKNEGILPITHPEMTRFNISLQSGVDMVLFALERHLGGEIFIPKIRSYRILDVAKAVDPNCKTIEIGLRPGEKIHEEMISEADSINTIDLGKYYAIIPPISFNVSENDFLMHHQAKKVPFGFKYNSGMNTEWEDVESLRKMISTYLSVSSNS